MYKKSLACLLALAPMGSAFADADIGCGLGTQIWQGTSGAVPRSLGATTNGSFGTQTFGITSGTSGCTNDGAITASARLPVYAEANLDQLADNMARGQGEALSGLASLYGIAEQDQPAFFTLTKAHFGEIFTHHSLKADEMLQNLNGVIARDQQLARYAS
jgi:hypothetical protein